MSTSILLAIQKKILKKFDVNEMIMHHIKDSHEFHIMDIRWPCSFISLLPIILWTDNGLVSFLIICFWAMTTDGGKIIVVSRKGQDFVKYHEKIFYAENDNGSEKYVFHMMQMGNIINKKPIDFSITKMVFSMFIIYDSFSVNFVFQLLKPILNSRKGEPTGLG